MDGSLRNASEAKHVFVKIHITVGLIETNFPELHETMSTSHHTLYIVAYIMKSFSSSTPCRDNRCYGQRIVLYG